MLVMYTSHHDHQVTHQNSEPNYASSVRKGAYFLSSWGPFSRSLLEALRETVIFLEAFVHLCASVKHCDITTTKRKRHCPALLDSLEMPDFDTSNPSCSKSHSKCVSNSHISWNLRHTTTAWQAEIKAAKLFSVHQTLGSDLSVILCCLSPGMKRYSFPRRYRIASQENLE